MCQHCKSGNVLIDEGLLDALIISSDLKPEDLKGLKTKAVKPQLTFKPDEDIGEGTATKEEYAYRQQLLNLLKDLHSDVEDVIKNDDEPLEKIEDVDKLIDSFIDDGQDIVNETIQDTWDEGIEQAIDTLNDIDDDKNNDTINPDTDKLDLILQQQLFNIEDVGLKIRGRIRQFILVQAINQQPTTDTKNKTIKKASPTPNSTWTECMRELHRLQPKLTETELRDQCEWDRSFVDAESNIDKMGVWGWIMAHEGSILATLIIGTGVIGDLIADWVTVGDDSVCDVCLDLESNNPYSVLDWPSDPHFGCRCEKENVRLASLED